MNNFGSQHSINRTQGNCRLGGHEIFQLSSFYIFGVVGIEMDALGFKTLQELRDQFWLLALSQPIEIILKK